MEESLRATWRRVLWGDSDSGATGPRPARPCHLEVAVPFRIIPAVPRLAPCPVADARASRIKLAS